jgi:uncharacterized protein
MSHRRPALAVALLAWACLPTAKEVKVDYFVLGGESRAQATPVAPAKPMATLAIVNATLPGYLDRGELATRSGARVLYSASERWAEPLADSVPRLLAFDMAATLGPDRIAVTSRENTAPEMGLQVELVRFERDADGRVVLEANWSLRSAADDRLVRTATSRFEESPGPGADAAVAALARLLGRLSDEIAESVRQLRPQAAAGLGRP